jgi:hypothetical protein
MSSLPVHLPAGFTPLVAVGDIVTTGQPLAARGVTSSTAIINVAHELSLPVHKVGKAIKKNPGDSVAPGDIIAVKKGFLGMGEQKVVSSVTGVVLTYERRTGEVTLKVDSEQDNDHETFPAPVAGRISMCDNGKIAIESGEEVSVTPSIEMKGNITAELVYLPYAEERPVPLHLLTHELSGKIVGGRAFDREGFVKLSAMEVAGVITIHVSDDVLSYVTRKHSFPLLIVEEAEFQKIMKRAGKEITLDGEKKKVVL